MSACYNSHTTICRALLRHRATVDLADNKGFSALHLCASRGNTSLVQILIRQGADVNISNHSTQTALHFCCKTANAAANITQLIGADANIEARDSSGMTPLMVACKEGVVSAVKELLRAHADPGAVVDDGSHHVVTGEAESASAIRELLQVARIRNTAKPTGISIFGAAA